MNCDVKCCIVPGPELGVVAGDDKGDTIVDPEVTDEPSGLESGGITLIIGGCRENIKYADMENMF